MTTAAEITAMVQRWLATEVAREVLAERARCAAACREMVARYRSGACGCAECEGRRDGARECAEAIERGPVTP